MLLAEEAHPLEELPRARAGLLHPPAEVGVLALELRDADRGVDHGGGVGGGSVGEPLRLLLLPEPRLRREGAPPEGPELVGQVADELLELAVGAGGGAWVVRLAGGHR